MLFGKATLVIIATYQLFSDDTLVVGVIAYWWLWQHISYFLITKSGRVTGDKADALGRDLDDREVSVVVFVLLDADGSHALGHHAPKREREREREIPSPYRHRRRHIERACADLPDTPPSRLDESFPTVRGTCPTGGRPRVWAHV